MKKHNQLLFWLKISPLFVTFILCLSNSNRLTYAQIPSQTFTSILSPVKDKNQDKPLTYNEYLTLIISAISLIFSAVSAACAIPSALFNLNSLRNLRSVLNKASPVISNGFDQQIKHTSDENEKQKLLQQKESFEKELHSLIKRNNASQKAKEWLHKNRESLADQSVLYALLDEETPLEDAKKKFRRDVNRYLYGIQECLNSGNYNPLHELDIYRESSRKLYEKALKFVIEKEATKTLHSESIEEMRIYLDYIIKNIL